MIDEKKLIDCIRHDIECYEADMMKDHDLYVRVADMIHMIEGQPKINRWIPVEERLPENGEVVLVTREYRNGRYYVERDEYYNDTGFESGADGDIMAWMPLPEPYRPE